MIKRLLIITLISFSAIIGVAVAGSETVVAASYDAGEIISDGKFTDSNSMNTGQIQDFLNQKNSTCLKNYSLNGESAAKLINDAAKNHGISPKVLIVTLQKEQGFITRTDCPQWRYNTAMGFGCPDSAPCDAQWYGLKNQLQQGARHFKGFYARSPGWYIPFSTGNRYVAYNPNSNCGGKTINIRNRATASLYSYTPYQPNQYALNGGTDGSYPKCGAFGNRNFFSYYTSWFGATKDTASNLPGCKEATNTAVACVWELEDSATGSQYLTTTTAERETFIESKGMSYRGVAFFGNVSRAPQPWNVPVYRLTSSSGKNMLTASLGEKNALDAGSWTYEGIEFYADPATSTNSGMPVSRLYSSSKKSHAWTTDANRKAQLLSQGYADEGIAFNSLSPTNQAVATKANEKHVYRFYIKATKTHFWTTAIDERDDLIKRGYSYEGIAWESYSQPTNTPIYRLYSTRLRVHLYTKSLSEKNALSANGVWRYEGISQYMSDTPNSKPVYRLYSRKLKKHLWTSDKSENDHLNSIKTFKSEGIAWYRP